MTKRRSVVAILEKNGYRSKGGSKHEKFVRGDETVLVERHRDIPDQRALQILRDAKLR